MQNAVTYLVQKSLHEKQMAQNLAILKAFRIQASKVTVLKDKSPLKQAATLLSRSKLFQGDKSTPKEGSHSTITHSLAYKVCK